LEGITIDEAVEPMTGEAGESLPSLPSSSSARGGSGFKEAKL
jgi:hypothetical protein